LSRRDGRSFEPLPTDCQPYRWAEHQIAPIERDEIRLRQTRDLNVTCRLLKGPIHGFSNVARSGAGHGD
jgi:hypothetical protein